MLPPLLPTLLLRCSGRRRCLEGASARSLKEAPCSQAAASAADARCKAHVWCRGCTALPAAACSSAHRPVPLSCSPPVWCERMHYGSRALRRPLSTCSVTALRRAVQRSGLACFAPRACRSRHCVTMQRDCGAVTPTLRPDMWHSWFAESRRLSNGLCQQGRGGATCGGASHAVHAARQAAPLRHAAPKRSLGLASDISDLWRAAAWPGAHRSARTLSTSSPCRLLVWQWRWFRAARRQPPCAVAAWSVDAAFGPWRLCSSSIALPPQPASDAAGRAGARGR